MNDDPFLKSAITTILVVSDIEQSKKFYLDYTTHHWDSEIRCFFKDPDGHLFEISQIKMD